MTGLFIRWREVLGCRQEDLAIGERMKRHEFVIPRLREPEVPSFNVKGPLTLPR